MLQQLKLHNFRNFVSLNLDLSDGQVVEQSFESPKTSHQATKFICLHGPNGAGKTNILESISLLSPGRGLRRASLQAMLLSDPNDADHLNPQSWTIYSKTSAVHGDNRIGLAYHPQKARQQIRINDEDIRSQAKLADYVSIMWLTPAMDRLFMEGASSRRRFLDRLIYNYDPAHAGRILAYEKLVKQRLVLLQAHIESGKQLDEDWLKVIETQMSARAIAITAQRQAMVRRLNESAVDYSPFPKANIELQGDMEGWLATMPASVAEEKLVQEFAKTRLLDGQNGTTKIGAHRSDMRVSHRAKAMAADQCSTGEQKALLIGLILSHLKSIMNEDGINPILLLDEITAHLDEMRTHALFDILGDINAQIWMSGVEEQQFSYLLKKNHKSQSYRLEAGAIIV